MLVARQPVKVRAVAHAAGSDTISDYKYTPSTITVTAGESVTWNNSGPTGHSATADDGSFDTGIFMKSSSPKTLTLSKTGTFKYHCQVHSFMKGTITVS